MNNASRITAANQAWLRWSPSFLCTLAPKAVPVHRKPKLCIPVLLFQPAISLGFFSLTVQAAVSCRSTLGIAVQRSEGPMHPSLPSPLPCASHPSTSEAQISQTVTEMQPKPQMVSQLQGEKKSMWSLPDLGNCWHSNHREENQSRAFFQCETSIFKESMGKSLPCLIGSLSESWGGGGRERRETTLVIWKFEIGFSKASHQKWIFNR